MSKAATIDALLESAIYCFSKEGYEGASLRNIARDAGVPLSTIHLYFGSKAELFKAVQWNAWVEIDQERSVLLEEAQSNSGDKPPPLCDLIHALAYPVARRALSKDTRDVALIFLLRSHWQPNINPGMLDIADRSMVRWIDAMAQNCPTLNRGDVVWAFSFVVGATYSWQLIDHRYDRLLDPDDERTADDVTRDLVTFCCSGIQAIVDQRANG